MEMGKRYSEFWERAFCAALSGMLARCGPDDCITLDYGVRSAITAADLAIEYRTRKHADDAL